ncbi:MAG: hypothetical protein KUA39_17915, partial [Desulfarculus sp.]|nr:hypothetical protein [Pseudomonadota bacterium]MBV1753495.1 hypothetical protein [Desulfarculus sp.]
KAPTYATPPGGGAGLRPLGDPAYYSRFGFKNHPEMLHEGVPREVFMVLPFGDAVPKGQVEFYLGFLATN